MTIRRLSLVLVLTLCLMGANAQSVESLRQQMKKAEADIKRSTELLNSTRTERGVSEQQLRLMQSRINSRKQVVGSLNGQIAVIDKEISTKNAKVNELGAELAALKKDYADMVYDSYKSYRMNNFLLFLFAAEDFNDLTRRIDFMRSYNSAREQKAQSIKAVTDSISAQVVDLGIRQEELNKTKAEQEREVSALAKDESQYKVEVAKLKQQESKISKELKAKQKQKDEIQRQIDRLIAAEIKKNSTVKRTAAQDREVKELTGRFDQNRGKLPYPVKGGVITERYGTHSDLIHSNVVRKSPGITITAPKGSDVTCVFDGEVTSIASIQGKLLVIVRHGEYTTSYGNLEKVYVKSGDKVKLNQKLGAIPSTDENNYLMFQLWKQFNSLNPELWLIK